MLVRNLLTLLGIALLADSSPGQASLPRINVGPGQGPRVDYRDEDWRFWWYLNHETLLHRRELAMAGAWEKAGRPPLRAPLTDDELDRVLAVLLDGRSDASPELQRALVMAMGRTQLRDALNPIRQAAAEGNLSVRRMAVRALGVLGDAAGVETLAELVGDEHTDLELRFDAAIALALLADVTTDADAVSPDQADDSTAGPPAALLSFPSVGPLADLRWRPDSDQLAAIRQSGAVDQLYSTDGARADWLASTGRPGAADAVEHQATHAAWSPKGEHLAIALRNGTVRLYRTPIERASTPITHVDDLVGLDWDPARGERLAIAQADGTARVFVAIRGRQLTRSRSTGVGLTSIAWQPGADRIASGRADGSIVLWSARSGTELTVVRPHSAAVERLAWRSDGVMLASAGADGRVFLWRGTRESGAELLFESERPIRALSWSPDGSTLACAVDDAEGSGGRVTFLDVATRARILDLAPEGDGIRLLSWSPRGDRIALCDASGMVAIHASPIPIGAPPGSGAGAVTAGATALAALLERKTFLSLPPVLQNGVALAAGISRQPSMGPALRDLLERKADLNDITRGYLALSLGTSGGVEQREALVRLLRHKNVHVRRSAALGLGALLEGTRDADAIGPLAKSLTRENDVTARNFVMLALGRLGWTGFRSLYQKLGDFDRGVLVTSGVATAPRVSLGGLSEQPFAALSVGMSRDGNAWRITVDRMAKERNHSTRSALAVALGLYGDRRAGKVLLHTLRDKKNPELKGYVLLALGMIGEERAISAIHQVLKEEIDIELLPQAARAARLLADSASIQVLLDRLESESSPGARRAVLFSLGILGDRATLEPLVAVLGNRSLPDGVRAYAAIALGMLADPQPVRRWARVHEHLNYTAEPTLFHELLSTL